MTGPYRSTWPELADLAASDAVLVVPVGATEQHGPPLPATTDTDIALAVVTAAAAMPEIVGAAIATCVRTVSNPASDTTSV